MKYFIAIAVFIAVIVIYYRFFSKDTKNLRTSETSNLREISGRDVKVATYENPPIVLKQV